MRVLNGKRKKGSEEGEKEGTYGRKTKTRLRNS